MGCICCCNIKNSVKNLFKCLFRLPSIFGRRFLIFIHLVLHCLKGFIAGGGAGGIIGIPVLFLFRSYEGNDKLDASQIQILKTISLSPWALKPIFGIISDLVYIGGYHKIPYMIVTFYLSVISCTVIAVLWPVDPVIATILLFMIFMNVSVSDLLVEAKYSEKIAKNTAFGPDLITFVQVGISIGQVLSIILTGFLLENIKPHEIYYIPIIPLIIISIPVLFNWMGEGLYINHNLQSIDRDVVSLSPLDQRTNFLASLQSDHNRTVVLSHDKDEIELQSFPSSPSSSTTESLTNRISSTQEVNENKEIELEEPISYYKYVHHDLNNCCWNCAYFYIRNPYNVEIREESHTHEHNVMSSLYVDIIEEDLLNLTDDMDDDIYPYPLSHPKVNPLYQKERKEDDDEDSGVVSLDDLSNSTVINSSIDSNELRENLKTITPILGFHFTKFKQQYKSVLIAVLIGVISICTSLLGLFKFNAKWLFSFSLAGNAFMIIAFHVLIDPLIAMIMTFMIVQNMCSISIETANFFFLTDSVEQYPEGPHFSVTFYVSVMGIVGSSCSILGMLSYNMFMKNWSYRKVFMFNNIVYILATLTNIILYKRWNIGLGLSDKFFVLGTETFQVILGTWTYLPFIILISQLCPPGMEATMFAILAGANNLGSSLAQYSGVFFLNLTGVNPSGLPNESNQFKNLWIVSLISSLLPLFACLLIPCLIPDMLQTESVDSYKLRKLNEKLKQETTHVPLVDLVLDDSSSSDDSSVHALARDIMNNRAISSSMYHRNNRHIFSAKPDHTSPDEI